MAFDFPNAPTVGQVFAPVGGTYYVWDGQKWAMTTQALVQTLTQTAEARNRIVNPAMMVSQENGFATSGVSGWYMADQWPGVHNASGAAVVYQLWSAVAPSGSPAGLRITVTTAKLTLAAADYLIAYQNIEGARVADFQWGTANAKPVVLRFTAFHSVAGTWSVALRNSDSTRSYVTTYTITAAQAGKYTDIVLPIPGDTTGTWKTDTGIGINLNFTFASGSGTLAPAAGWNAGNFLGVTGMDNGLGSTAYVYRIHDVGLYLDFNNTGKAPPFAVPDFADELAACKRYWQVTAPLSVYGYGNAFCLAPYTFSVQMRTAPIIGVVAAGTVVNVAAFYQDQASPNHFRFGFQVSAAGVGSIESRVLSMNARM